MGTPQIAVPALEALINSRHEVIAVITQPDQKSGRGMSVRFSPVKEIAVKYGIECLQPESISDESVLDMLEQMNADIYAVAAYAQKIPNRLLEMAPFGCINLHPSLLPKYRGSGPLRGPILNGDEETGVTIMKLVEQWDAGDILMQRAFAMDPKETSETLEEKCKILGAQMMLETIDGLENGSIKPVPQDSEKATYLKQITKDAGLIDFGQSAVQIERQIRACIPWPSAFTYMDGKTFKIWAADVYAGDCANVDAASADMATGSVAYVDKKKLLIKTGLGYLEPTSVQLEGKKRMAMDEFLRGKKIEQGYHFGK